MKSYSYSAFKDFDNCPRQMYLLRIAKAVSRKYDSSGPGRAFHKVMDQAVKFQEERLPSAFKAHEWVLKRIEKIRRRVETEMPTGVTSVNSEMGLSVDTQWNAGPMFAKDAFYCGSIDFVMMRGSLAYITDWKFGNSGYADTEQLRQQACLLFSAMPEVNCVRTDLTFVKDMVIVPRKPMTIMRSELDDLRSDIAMQANRIHQVSTKAMDMLQRGEISDVSQGWPAQQNGLCNRFCPVTKEHCEFSPREKGELPSG